MHLGVCTLHSLNQGHGLTISIDQDVGHCLRNKHSTRKRTKEEQDLQHNVKSYQYMVKAIEGTYMTIKILLLTFSKLDLQLRSLLTYFCSLIIVM